MRIATLQYAPQVGQVSANLARVNEIFNTFEAELVDLELLVLPEMAFTGYNFSSFAEITPFLEPTACGMSTKVAIDLALRFKCTVCVGYPEMTREEVEINGHPLPKCYNSLVIVDSAGDVVANYRKTFLYYTDETWATEGNGFWAGELDLRIKETITTTYAEAKKFLEKRSAEEADADRNGTVPRRKRPPVRAAAGICMDINSYKFQGEKTEFDFAKHVLEQKADLVILCMAWLTTLSEEAMSETPEKPDMDTLTYWLTRLGPLWREVKGATTPGSEREDRDREIIVVCANRAGKEGNAIYAGTSCVVGLSGTNGVRCWNVIGKDVDGFCLIDTEEPPKYWIPLVPRDKVDDYGPDGKLKGDSAS